ELLSVDEQFRVTVNNVNDPPEVVSPLGDLVLDEHFGTLSINLTEVFIDPDGDVLQLTAASSDPAVVTVSVSGTNNLIITESGLGTADITVTANDGVLSVSDQFNVVVNNVNDAPVAVSPISSISRNEGFGSVVIDLATVFVDPDGDAMTYGAVSSNTNVVTVLLSGTTLTISEVGNGLSTITVTASDGELSTDDQFTFTINNINDEPEVVQPIGDRSYDEGFNAVTIGLSTRFSDPDGDVLTYKALSSNTDIATVSVSGSILTIREVGLGSSEITVTATDDGEGNLSVSDVFTLTVLNVNDAPQLDNPIANQVVDEYFGTLEIDLSGTFSDPDDDALIITATSNNIGVVTVNTVGSVLRITEVGLGLSWITVTASDGALSVSTQFLVAVNNVNDAPVVVSPLADRNYEEGFGSSSFSLAPVFLDPDGDLLTLSVSSSNTSAVIVSISGTTLTITETGLGVATIMVTASDGSLSANDQFTVTVNNVNDRPVVNQPISDRVVDEHFGSIEIDLSSVFSDPDVGDVLTYSAVSSINSVVEVSVTGAILTITEAGLGTATITVTATDDGEGNLSKSDQFTMTVNNVNDPPIVANPVPDQIFDEHFGSATIDLSATFSDPDAGTILSLSVVSSNPSVVTVSLSGTILTMNETGLGTSTVSVTADDGVLSVDDQFTVTVNDVNDPPAVVAPLADQEVDEYFGSVEFDLTGVFNDPDGDVLTFTAESNANGVVTVEVTGTMLTVTEAGLGSANITVTASDGLLSAETGFMITVFNVNDAPDLAETIPDQYIVENIGSAEIDLDSYFFDRDGDALVYSVAMRDAGIVTYEQDQSVLTSQPAAVGSTMVTVTGSDPGGLTAVDSFMVHVEKEYLLVVNHGSRRIQNKDTIILCNDAGNITVRVNSKIAWDFTGTTPWMVVGLTADSALDVGFSANLTGDDRTGMIRVFDVQGHNVEFYVQQTENCQTGIAGATLPEVSLYPNPLRDKLYIDTGGRFEKVSRVEIIDFRGQLLYMEQMEGDIAGAPLEIDMQGYTEGIYFVRITGDGNSFTGKIVKH
ncbi:MAG: T9SS type A sorting domain-containing protein, partial [Actinobacteria bacterium]|nr:T9SS type A sorting domain-containing protein [Actinomycetota bacterium]